MISLLGPIKLALKAANRQKEIIRVACVLPGNYQYKQVEEAINASGVCPHDIYMGLMANKKTVALDEKTVALARFYEALLGPK